MKRTIIFTALLLSSLLLVNCGMFPCFDKECYDEGTIPDGEVPDREIPEPPPSPTKYQVKGHLTAGSQGMISWKYRIRGGLTNYVSSPPGKSPGSVSYSVVTGNM